MMTEDKRKLGRRDMLRISAVAAGGLGIASWGASTWAHSGRLNEVLETRVLMGSPAQLRLLTADPRRARAAIEAAFSEMERLEGVLSRFRPSSELSQLNRSGRLQTADAGMLQVVERALSYGRLTEGAFDISVEPLLAAYRVASENGGGSSSAEIERLRSRVDYKSIRVQGRRIEFSQPGMAITLDGIAKGFIIDQGAASLRQHGFDQVLVEVGGDMLAGQHAKHAWRVGIRTPRAGANSALLGTASLLQRALATSGDYLNAFSQDFSLHHILAPTTGRSPLELASVSVLAPTAMDADALSTAVMVLGAEAGLGLVEGLPGVEALLVDKDMRIRRSSGFALDDAG